MSLAPNENATQEDQESAKQALKQDEGTTLPANPVPSEDEAASTEAKNDEAETA